MRFKIKNAEYAGISLEPILPNLYVGGESNDFGMVIMYRIGQSAGGNASTTTKANPNGVIV